MTTATIPTRVFLPRFLNLELTSKDEGLFSSLLFSSLPLAIVLPTPISNSTVASPTGSTFFQNPVIPTLRSRSSVIITSPTNTSAVSQAIAPVLSVSASGKDSTSNSNSNLNQNTPKAVTGNTQTIPAPTVAAFTAPVPLAIAFLDCF